MRVLEPNLLSLTLVSVWFFSNLSAIGSTQRSSQFTAVSKNNRASDQSMEKATDHAMLGLMNLASSNISGAINNGYKAYSNYITSEDLDELADDSRAKARALASLDSEDARDTGAGSGPQGADRTTFRRLDKNFLYKGQTNTIAAEFEKRTGMSREKFLEVLATASEQKISPDDPKLVEKVVYRFKSFANSIPNAKFRGQLNRVIATIPESMQKGIIAKGISRMVNYFASGEAVTDEAEDVKAAKVGGSAETLPELDNSNAVSSEETVNRAVASTDTLPITGVLSDILAENPDLDDRTIFMIVSERYKQIIPELAKLPGK